MCGRFYVPDTDLPEELLALLSEAERRRLAVEPGFRLKRGELAPGDTVAVVAPGRAAPSGAFPMRWGFRLGTPARLVFNARSESAGERPLFRESFASRRCLLPAAAYFEWDHRQKRPEKYRFFLPGEPLLYLAGLYRLTAEGAECTVLTREAAGPLADFHERMPVILPREAHAAWLNPREKVGALLGEALTELQWAKE